jgi:ribonucleoside-diphosphate reductase beta chain
MWRAGTRPEAGDVNLQHQCLAQFGIDPIYRSAKPFGFLELKEGSNFFERRICVYQVAVAGNFAFDEDF